MVDIQNKLDNKGNFIHEIRHLPPRNMLVLEVGYKLQNYIRLDLYILPAISTGRRI